MTVRLTEGTHLLLSQLCKDEGVTMAAFTEAALMHALLHPADVLVTARLTTETRRHAGGRPKATKTV